MRQDRPRRFVVAWAAGPREAVLAAAVVQATRQRTAAQAGIPWISDGWGASVETITAVSCDPLPTAIHDGRILRQTPAVRLTQAVKHRQGRHLARIEVRAPIGAPADQPYPVHSERLTGV